MFAFFILSAVLPPQQDDGSLRARVQELVRNLGDDDFQTREAAEKELLGMPAHLAPEIAALGAKSSDSEVRTRIARLALPDPWPKLLAGNLREARQALDQLTNGRPSDRRALISRMLTGLEGRHAVVVPALEGLLASEEVAEKEFALAGLARFPTRDAARLLPFLEEEDLRWRASEALIAANDPSIVARVVDVFAKGGAAAHDAARVLDHFGPGEAIDRVATLVREKEELASVGIRILARAKAEDALAGLLAQKPKHGTEIVRVLEKLGSERSLPALRAWLKEHPEARDRDRVLFNLRDREWAREKLAEARKQDGELSNLLFDQIAAAGGPALREEALDWLRTPGLKVSVQLHLLPLLGAVGRAEDGAFLAGKLKERRLRNAAGEALGRLGDPVHARALMEAYKKSESGVDLQRAVAALPAEELEEDLLEILADPAGFRADGDVVFRLVARRLTPRLREALYKGILEGEIAWTSLRAEALRILADSVRPEDGPWIEKLRAHKGRDATVNVCGLLVAVRSGDRAAASELAPILAGQEKFFLPHSASSEWGASAHVLQWATPTGATWARAVTEAWRARPEWIEGALWLTAREVREAQEYLAQRREKLDPRWRPQVEAALSARGDPEALDRLFARAKERNYLSPQEERAFVAAAGRDRRARVVEEARKRVHYANDPMVRLTALMAHPEGVALYRGVVSQDQTDWGWLNHDDRLAAPCARALARLKVKDAAPDVRSLLRSQNAQNRAAAAEALGDLGDRDSVPALVRLLDDPFEVEDEQARMGTDYLHQPKCRVWDAAMEALERIAGLKSEGATGADRRAFWRAWHEKNRGAGR